MIKQRNKNKERGITLVALVVTIVVLLILAGVTITYVLGDHGIFKLAMEAKNKTENAMAKEQEEIGDLVDWLEGEGGGEGKDEIEDAGGIWRAKKSDEIKCSNLEIQVYSKYYNVDDIDKYKEKYILREINEVQGTEYTTLDEFASDYGYGDEDFAKEMQVSYEIENEIYINKEGIRKIILTWALGGDYNSILPEELLQEYEQCTNEIEQMKFDEKYYVDIALYGLGYTTEDIEQIEQEYINNHTEKQIPQEIKNATYTITYPNGSTAEILGNNLDKVKGIYKVEENGNNTIKVVNKANNKEETLNIQISNLVKNVEDQWYQYTYINSLAGYGAKVKDTTLTSYGKIQSNLNGIPLISLRRTFEGCENLTNFSFAAIDTSKVVDMSMMFRCCFKLSRLDVSSLNTSNVTDMTDMFLSCSNLASLDVSNFNTSNVTSMCGMFQYCSSLTSLDLSNFNTSNVFDMSYMFADCSNLASLDVSNFNTSNVFGMSVMFSGCRSLTSLDLSNFNTSKVSSMGQMFQYCESLTSLDLSNFNTANVTYMSNMFLRCKKLTNLNLSGWKTTKLTKMTSVAQNGAISRHV